MQNNFVSYVLIHTGFASILFLTYLILPNKRKNQNILILNADFMKMKSKKKTKICHDSKQKKTFLKGKNIHNQYL